MMHTVGPKGQIVIAKEIREQLGIQPGWVAVQRVVDGQVVLDFLPAPHRRSLRGILAGHIQHPISDQELEDATHQAWGERWAK